MKPIRQITLLIVAIWVQITPIGSSLFPAWNRWHSVVLLSRHLEAQLTHVDAYLSLYDLTETPVIGIVRGKFRRAVGDQFLPTLVPGDKVIAVVYDASSDTMSPHELIRILTDFPELELVHFNGGSADGEFSRLKRLPSLKDVAFVATDISDREASEILSIPALESFTSYKCDRITFDLGADFTPSSNIRELNLEKSNCNDASIATINKFKGLEHLNLSETQVTPEGIRSLSLPRLKSLYLCGLKIDRESVESLNRFPIEHLYIRDTGASDHDLLPLTQFRGLHTLRLSEVNLTADAVFKFIQDCQHADLEVGTTVCPSNELLRILPKARARSFSLRVDDVAAIEKKQEQLIAAGWKVQTGTSGWARFSRAHAIETQ